MSQNRSGSRLLLEGVVILVSILVALLLEGWRDDVELRRDTERQLASVRTELQRNQQLLDTHLRAVGRAVEAGQALASAMSSASAQQTVGSEEHTSDHRHFR